jgi:hypothetical protein
MEINDVEYENARGTVRVSCDGIVYVFPVGVVPELPPWAPGVTTYEVTHDGNRHERRRAAALARRAR